MRRLVEAALLALLLLPAASTSSIAQDPPSQSDSARAARGELLYRIYCRNCHGDKGKSRGPMSKLLSVRPANLTILSRQNDGSFPADEVREAIDGREEVRSHGMREMPVWGLSFQEQERDSDQEREVRGQIDDLVAYLRSIQKK
jgi:mono/diheme cytochrome c family protein